MARLTDRKDIATRELEAAGWQPEPGSTEKVAVYRLPGKTDREIGVKAGGGLEWRYQDRGGVWRTNDSVTGDEEVGVQEAIDALARFESPDRPVADTVSVRQPPRQRG